jgi:hypothetical protein
VRETRKKPATKTSSRNRRVSCRSPRTGFGRSPDFISPASSLFRQAEAGSQEELRGAHRQTRTRREERRETGGEGKEKLRKEASKSKKRSPGAQSEALLSLGLVTGGRQRSRADGGWWPAWARRGL